MRYFTLRKFHWYLLIIVFSVSQFIPPPIVVDAQPPQPCTSAIVSYQIYAVDAGGGWAPTGVFGQVDVCSALVCLPGQGLILVRPPSGAEFWHCGGGGLPDPPPNLPGIYAGAACQAGSSRTVSITPTGDTHDIQISPSNQIVALAGNSYTFTNLQQGVSYQFQARAENSGGSSGWSSWTAGVQQDLSAPTTTLDLVGTAGLNTWWQSAVSATLPATDSGCLGVSSTLYTLDSVANTYTGSAFNISGEGTHSLSYYSTDGSYAETAQNATILIDTVVPSLTLTPDRLPDGAAGWWIDPVTVSLSASDATSGIDTLDSNLNSAGWTNYINPIALTVDGTYNLDGRVIDVAGWETVDGLSISIDSTAPYLSFVFSREPDRNGWYNESVHVAIQSSDSTSGLAGIVAQLTYEGIWRPYEGAYLIGGDGEHIFEAIATDTAGNISARQTIVPIDITPPETTLIWDGQELDFTVSDNRSGVMGTTVTINGVVTRYIGEAIEFEIAGDYRIEVYSTDMAGNDEAVQVLNISYEPDAETALIPLSPPTLSAEITCSAERYNISGFASSSAGLGSIYLLEGDSIVTGGRSDYSPASTDVEAFAFYYVLSENETPDLSLVALADDGSERRLSVNCPDESILLAPFGFANDEFYNRLLALNPLDDVPEMNTGTSVAETDNNDVSESLNQYPNSLGDISTVLEEVAPNEIQDPVPVPASAQQATSNTDSGSSNAPSAYVPPQVIDTSVTLLDPSSPDLTYVTGKASTLSAEELAKILAATGLLATATAGVGLQMTETAQRRKEELEAERLAEQARLEKERLAQAERARENVEMNAQMREDAQKEVFIEVEQSEANKRYHEHVAALWAEYYAHIEAWNQNQQVLALAQAQAYTLEPGSLVADLPQEIQNIFWQLGNMGLEYAEHFNEETGARWNTNVADGQWAFQETERENLINLQYLIRTATDAGDLQAVIEHATKAAGYVNKTLVTRIDRELDYARDAGVENTRIEQERSYNTYRYGNSQSELRTQQTQIAVEGISTVIDDLQQRANELQSEMKHRAHLNLNSYIGVKSIENQFAASSTIIENKNIVLGSATISIDIVSAKRIGGSPATLAWTDVAQQQQLNGEDFVGSTSILEMARDDGSDDQLEAQLAYLQIADVSLETNNEANGDDNLRNDWISHPSIVDSTFDSIDALIKSFTDLPDRVLMVENDEYASDRPIVTNQPSTDQTVANNVFIFQEIVGPISMEYYRQGPPRMSSTYNPNTGIHINMNGIETSDFAYIENLDRYQWDLLSEIGIGINARAENLGLFALANTIPADRGFAVDNPVSDPNAPQSPVVGENVSPWGWLEDGRWYDTVSYVVENNRITSTEQLAGYNENRPTNDTILYLSNPLNPQARISPPLRPTSIKNAWGDMFAGWVLDGFNTNVSGGVRRQEIMDAWVPRVLNTAYMIQELGLEVMIVPVPRGQGIDITSYETDLGTTAQLIMDANAIETFGSTWRGSEQSARSVSPLGNEFLVVPYDPSYLSRLVDQIGVGINLEVGVDLGFYEQSLSYRLDARYNMETKEVGYFLVIDSNQIVDIDGSPLNAGPSLGIPAITGDISAGLLVAKDTWALNPGDVGYTSNYIVSAEGSYLGASYYRTIGSADEEGLQILQDTAEGGFFTVGSPDFNVGIGFNTNAVVYLGSNAREISLNLELIALNARTATQNVINNPPLQAVITGIQGRTPLTISEPVVYNSPLTPNGFTANPDDTYTIDYDMWYEDHGLRSNPLPIGADRPTVVQDGPATYTYNVYDHTIPIPAGSTIVTTPVVINADGTLFGYIYDETVYSTYETTGFGDAILPEGSLIIPSGNTILTPAGDLLYHGSDGQIYRIANQ